MFVIIKLDVQKSETSIVAIDQCYETALNCLNAYIKKIHSQYNMVIYLEDSRITVYERCMLFGKSMRFSYQIIKYDKENEIECIYDHKFKGQSVFEKDEDSDSQ